MARLTPATSIGGWFWVLFATSTVANLSYSASIPILPRFVKGEFGGGPAAVGLVVAIAPLVSLPVQPLAGVAADRWGYRRLTVVGCALGCAGMVVTMGAFSVTSVGVGRLIFGVGESVVLTVVIAWVVGVADPTEQGRTLSIFGVSVWIGFALGPVLSENIYQHSGFRAVWAVCAVLPLVALALAAFLPTPSRDVERPSVDSPRMVVADAPEHVVPAVLVDRWRVVIRAVAAPGTVAAIVWGSQTMLMAYLVLHLEAQGMRTDGATGAASVFTVFAGSVIAARLVVGPLPDMVGPARAAQYGLAVLVGGLLIITVADNFVVASLGAVVLGLAFAPLYPALVMLTVEGLDASRRATALGGFNALTSLGSAVGGFAGGVMSLRWGESSAFLATAVAQVVAMAVLAAHRKCRSATIGAAAHS